ncbi:hypothetical protein ACFQX4_10365, partial [Roseomonas sp. GCM10028921]
LVLQPEGRMPVPHYHEAWEETVYGLAGTVSYTAEGEAYDNHIRDPQRASLHRQDCIFLKR